MPLTLHLAVAFGVYIAAASLGMLLMPAARVERLYQELADSPGLVMAYGVIAFVVGAAWIMVHHEWLTGLGMVVSLVGWIMAIEGVLMLAAPAVMIRIALVFRPVLKPACVIAIVVGVLLIVAGLTGRADADIFTNSA